LGGIKIKRTKYFLLIGLILFLVSGVKVNAATGYNRVESEGAYTGGVSPLGATPPEYADSKVDLGDAFWFTGNYRYQFSMANPNDPNATRRNYAYRSAERSNVAMLYPGDTLYQKSQMWYNSKLDLNKKFELEYLVYLTRDEALSYAEGSVPDGMTFVMQNDPHGVDAIGGMGIGIGVYPWTDTHPNFIYNAVTVEMDTSPQIKPGGYDYDIGQLTKYPWPHMAMVSTRTPGYTGYGGRAPGLAYNNAKIHNAPTVVNSEKEAYSFFKEWVPIKVSWVPNNNGTGTLSYTVKTSLFKEVTRSQEFNILESFRSNYDNPSFDNKVYWGFTGSNYNTGNPIGIMITKLPQQPMVTGERSVLNTTKEETTYKTETVANVGDVVTYKVRVNNKVTDESDIALVNTSVKESLKGNTYVDGSFTFNSPYTSQEPVPEIKDDNFTFNDSNYKYKPGEYFEYTYQVKITDKSSVFTNTTQITTSYSEGKNLNDTTVFVNPSNLSVTKSADNLKPKVGDTVKLTSKLNIKGGTFNLTSITDSLPEGMELVANSTSVIQTAVSDGTEEELLSVPDSSWSEGDLTIDLSASPITVLGGSDQEQLISLTYEVKVLDSIKGETIVSPLSQFSGGNNYSNVGQETYAIESNAVTFNIQTDITIYFKNTDDTLIDSTHIISSNSKFNKKNPVVLYYQTGDKYDVSEDIQLVSNSLLTNDTLTEVRQEGNNKGTIPKEGVIITVFYSENVTMTIKYLVKGTTNPIYTNINTQTEKTSDVITDVKVGASIESTVNALISDKKITLSYAGYLEPSVKSYTLENAIEGQNTSVVPTNDFTIIYYFDGSVYIDDVTNLDFGEISIFDKIASGFLPDQSKEQKMSIINTTDSSGWELSARLEADISNFFQGDKYNGSLVFGNNENKGVTIDTQSTLVFTETDTVLYNELDFNNRFKLFNSGNNLPGLYTGKIIWSITQGP